MINQIVNLIGVLLGIIFLVLSSRASRSLVGSVFKRYHYWLMVGAALFSLSFLADFIGGTIGQMDVLDTVHHILLLLAVFIFIVTNLQLPKEASKYLELKNEEKQEGSV